MKKSKSLILLISALALFSSSASAIATLDQSYEGSAVLPYGNGELYRAQTFTVGITGVLTRFEVLMSGTGSSLFEIWNASSGLPLATAGVALASGTVNFATGAPPETLFFGANVSLGVTAGDVLAIVQIGNGSTGPTAGAWYSSLSNGYAGGSAFTTSTPDPEGALNAQSGDFGFKTYISSSVADTGSTLALLSAALLGLAAVRRKVRS